MNQSEKKTYLVTGGGSGIGRAIVRDLSESGAHVITCGRRQSLLEETASICRNSAGSIEIVTADLTNRDDLRVVVDAVLGKGGKLDGLVNNAGVVMPKLFPDWEETDLDHLLETNLRVPIRLIQQAWPGLVKAKGRIINLSSLAVLWPFPRNGAYGITKSALDGLTRAIHVEAVDTGVKAFSIALGAVETPMLRRLVDQTMLPLHKAMAPQEAAALVTACLSGERDEDAGKVLFAAIPGLVTSNADQAEAALALLNKT